MWLLVMAWTISSLRAFCSRKSSLFQQLSATLPGWQGTTEEYENVGGGDNVHRLVDLIHRQFAMNLFHGVARLLHGSKSLSIDIGGLDSVDLLVQGPYLSNRLV
jgi:hypothetical protein